MLALNRYVLALNRYVLALNRYVLALNRYVLALLRHPSMRWRTRRLPVTDVSRKRPDSMAGR